MFEIQLNKRETFVKLYNRICSVVTVPVSAITGLRLVVEVFPEVI